MRYKAGLETRERILGATRSLVAENGLDGTTIKAICELAGVLPGSFYNLFASKEQAILTVVREAIDAVDPDPDHHGTDTLEDLVAAYVRFLEERLGVPVVLVSTGPRREETIVRAGDALDRLASGRLERVLAEQGAPEPRR